MLLAAGDHRRARQDRAQVLRATSRTRSPVSCTRPGRRSAGSTSAAAHSHLPPTPAVTTRRSCSGPAGAREVRHVTTPRLRTRAMDCHAGGGAVAPSAAAACATSTAAMSVCPPWYRKLMARRDGCLLPASSSMRTDRFLFLYSQGTLCRSKVESFSSEQHQWRGEVVQLSIDRSVDDRGCQTCTGIAEILITF